MSLRVLTSLFTGICMLLIFAAAPGARAYVQGGDVLIGKNLDRNASSKPLSTTLAPDRSLRRPEAPWGGQTPGQRPYNDETSAPIPEPGTLTLASLGLVALGTALRKRRNRRVGEPAR